METYIVLMNYTQHGITNLQESPVLLDEARHNIEAAGGKVLGAYLTMGRYDIALVAEVPDSTSIAKLLLSLGSKGSVRTETLRAIGEEEFRRVLASLS